MSAPCKIRFTTWINQKAGGAMLGEVVVAEEHDAALSQLAALREELEIAKGVMASQGETIGRVVSERDGAQQRLADAERRNADYDFEIAAQVESALRRSFSLGQVYWQQADSDSTRQQNKSDQTMEVQAQHILNVLKSISAALNKPEEAKS